VDDMSSEDQILQRLTRVETKLDIMLSDNSREKRIAELEDNQRWLWRAIFGTFIAGAVSYLLKVM
jgi:hypothetical protein